MSKTVYHGKEAREKLREGVNILADSVASTIGPRGRNAVLDTAFGSPVITNDGVSIADDIDIEDRAANLGCRIIKQAAEKSNGVVGDGTTTSTIIAQSLINNGLDMINNGADPLTIKRGLDKALPIVQEYLKDRAKPVESYNDYLNVAIISAESKELGTTIADLIKEVGKDGVTSVEDSAFPETSTEILEGFQFYKGYMSPYFVTSVEKMEVELFNPYILIIDKKINEFQEISKALKACVNDQNPNIVVICHDATEEVIATAVVNNQKNGFKITLVKSPTIGKNRNDILDDIAILTGGKLLSENNGISLTKIEDTANFGKAKRVIITSDSTTIIDGEGNKEAIENRIKELETVYANDKQLQVTIGGAELQQRIGKLRGKVGIIKVGGATEVEQRAIRHKVDDALAATKASLAEGIVAGGGITLLDCAKYVEKLAESGDSGAGFRLLAMALEAPIRKICQNAGVDPDKVIEYLEKQDTNIGFNALTLEYENFLEKGIIDPVKVTRMAVESAISVSGILLTTESLVVNNDNVNHNKYNAQ